MSNTLTDPVLGKLTASSDMEWTASVWLTPKHEVGIAFRQSSFPEPPGSAVTQTVVRIRGSYLRIREREWAYRRRTAEILLARGPAEWSNLGIKKPTLEKLMRLLEIHRILFYGDGSANIVYRGSKLAKREIYASINPADDVPTVSVTIIHRTTN